MMALAPSRRAAAEAAAAAAAAAVDAAEGGEEEDEEDEAEWRPGCGRRRRGAAYQQSGAAPPTLPLPPAPSSRPAVARRGGGAAAGLQAAPRVAVRQAGGKDRPRYGGGRPPGARALEAWRTTAAAVARGRRHGARRPGRHHPEPLVPFEKALERKHGVSGGMFAWLRATGGRLRARAREARAPASRAGGAPEADAAWQARCAMRAPRSQRAAPRVRRGRPLARVRRRQRRARAPSRRCRRRPAARRAARAAHTASRPPIVALVDGGLAPGLVTSLGAFPEHEAAVRGVRAARHARE